MDTNKHEDILKKILFSHYGNSHSDLFSFDLNDYVHAWGDPFQALLYSALFMPELTILEDSVILKKNVQTQECVKRFLDSKKKNKSVSEIESSFNFIEVLYQFGGELEISNEEELLLAHRIRDAWDGWLKVKFPGRKFVVEVLSPEETGSCVGVHFFQKR